MNHWISKHAEDKERCSACGEAVPNASGSGGVLVSGKCQGGPTLPRGQHIVCASCMHGEPWLGRYEMVEMERHGGFCEQCGKFVGDGFYVVRDPSQQKNAAGMVTSTTSWGIWAEPPETDVEHTCSERDSLAEGVALKCAGCEDRRLKHGIARFLTHPASPTAMRWAFASEAAAEEVIEALRRSHESDGWTYEARALS